MRSQPRGRPIVTEQNSVKLLESEELIAWEILYQTVVDCYKIATSQWRHFKCMRWHLQGDYKSILATARVEVESWIESEAFADYVYTLGWNPEEACQGVRDVLNGKRNSVVRPLIKQIAKERDSRRNREEKQSEH